MFPQQIEAERLREGKGAGEVIGGQWGRESGGRQPALAVEMSEKSASSVGAVYSPSGQ